MKPRLRCGGLDLVPVQPGDLDAFCRLLWDRDVRRFLCDDVELSREQIATMLTRSDELDEFGLGLWKIRSAERELLGCVGLHPVVPTADNQQITGEVEPVIALLPTVWGRGHAHDALRAILHYAFHDHAMARLVAIVDEPNAASRRLMTRVGFREIGGGQGPKYRQVFYDQTASAWMSRTELPARTGGVA